MKPRTMESNENGIPRYMHDHARFCFWRMETRKGDITKVPFNPNDPKCRAQQTGAIFGTRLAGSSDMSYVTVSELKTFKKITGGDSLFAELKASRVLNSCTTASCGSVQINRPNSAEMTGNGSMIGSC